MDWALRAPFHKCYHGAISRLTIKEKPMEKITDALMLKETAPRSNVAITYGLIGLIVGVVFLSDK